MSKVPYSKFKKDFLQLCDHVLAKKGKMINLNQYTGFTTTCQVREANQTHVCGTPACLAGSLPEVFPRRFKWDAYGDPRALGAPPSAFAGICCMLKLVGEDALEAADNLPKLFQGRWDKSNTDRKEVKIRRKLVESSPNYKQLDINILHKYTEEYHR
jgi:hypothetical protein